MGRTVEWLLFDLSAGALGYVYFAYPLLTAVLARRSRRRKRIFTSTELPSVSIVISTRDCAENVRARIEDCLALDYLGSVEILIGCDDSPQAYRAAQEFVFRGVKAFTFPRVGKATIQNRLIAQATGEIIVTTDVQTRFSRDFLRQITAPFADPRVGGVTGVMRIGNPDASGTAKFETSYWSFEHWFRQQESDTGILLGVAGACFAFRRRLYREIGEASDSDNLVPLELAEQHYRIIQAPEAVVFEEAIETPEQELRNRVRSVTRSFADYLRYPRLLNPFRYPGPFLWIVSHKYMRFLTPYFAVVLWVAACTLRDRWVCRIAFRCGLLFLAGSILGWLVARFRRLPLPWAVVVSLLVVNLAFGMGTLQALRGKRIVTW